MLLHITGEIIKSELFWLILGISDFCFAHHKAYKIRQTCIFVNGMKWIACKQQNPRTFSDSKYFPGELEDLLMRLHMWCLFLQFSLSQRWWWICLFFWPIQLQQKLSKIRVTLGEFPCWRAFNDSLQNVILELWLLYTSSHNALSSSETFLFAQISLCWLQHLLYLVFSWVISCNSGEYGSEVLN